MMTPFRKRKVEKLFDITDVDGNGVIEFADYERVLSNLAERRGWDDSNPDYQRVKSLLEHSWKTLCISVDQNEDQMITRQEWYNIWERFYEIVNYKPGEIPDWFAESASHFFRTLDVDGDGRVSKEDYASFLEAYQIPEDPAPLFARLDLNGDGHVSQEEGILLATQFYLGDDEEEPGTVLYGPIP